MADMETTDYYEREVRRNHPEILDEWVERLWKTRTILSDKRTVELDIMATFPNWVTGFV